MHAEHVAIWPCDDVACVMTWQVRVLHGAGAPLVVVTLGADGAIAATSEQWWFQPTQERPVVDTTGCGDVRAATARACWYDGMLA